MAAVFPHDLLLNLEKKEARSRAADHKDAKEVLHQLDEADSDDEAPPLEEGDEETENITQSRKLVDEGRVVEEGDLPDDLMDQLGAGEEEEGGYDQILHQEEEEGGCDQILHQERDQRLADQRFDERDQRLVDQRFDVFLSQYDDDKIGELTEEVGPTHGGEKDEQYYYDLLKQYIKTGDAEGKEILQAGGADVEENEDGEWVRRAHWKDEPRGYADIGEEPTEAEREDLNKKIRSLALKEAEVRPQTPNPDP
ncbi:hypothetical protein T484DRAFT_1766151 [Baffinella frigidus]|nr:hypothetical protein T484DRAFT_1766151 [Cryptophyta sp. CCMP2293]